LYLYFKGEKNMGAIDDVRVHTTLLQTSSTTAKTGSSDATNLSNDLDTALADLVTSLNAVDILTGLAGTLETFGTGLMATLACFATGLTAIDYTLAVASSAFKGLDTTLANTFTTLENQLNYYTGYETTAVMPTIHASSIPTGTFAAQTTTISFQASHHSSFWGSVGHFFSSAWHATTGFVAHHWKGIAIGTIIVAGVALTVFTAGGSDAAAGAGVAALGAA
jgi:hypothetical protein